MSQGAWIIKTDTSAMRPCIVTHPGLKPISQALTRKSDTPVNGT